MKKLALIAVVISMLGCADSGSSSKEPASVTPTDTKQIFSLFPPGYFEGSYSASYTLTGAFTNGQGVTASIDVKSGGTTTFNSQAAKTITSLGTITNTSTSAVVNNFNEQYFSIDKNNLIRLGARNTVSAVTDTATSVNVLPSSGSIGDFGMFGSYAMSDGKSYTMTWALNDAGNGKAALAVAATMHDSASALFATSIETWTVAQDGTRSAVAVKVTLHQQNNLTLNMSGPKK